MFNFFKYISSKFKSGIEEENDNAPSIPMEKESFSEKTDVGGKRWNKDCGPWRRVILWGIDDNNNPSFLVLYGIHELTQSHTLCGEIKYTSYAIFRGMGGHLPSPNTVEFPDRYNIKYGMFYKGRYNNSYDWSKREEFKVKEFYALNPENQVSLPYFAPVSHEEIIRKITYRRIKLTGFRPVSDPNDILNLRGELAQYLDLVVEMICNQNIYTRKKLLSELLAKNPPKELYYRLLNTGSSELISGLFLELAKKNNPILKEEAEELLEAEIDWAGGNYAKGIKRCAQIYINALDLDHRAKRTEWIRESLKNMDLHLININGKEVPSEKIIDGAAYRKYANQGKLMDYMHTYDYEKRKSVRQEAPIRYKAGPYCDGRKLKLIDFKNTIQEAEVYELADVIGKIAYYLDAPRLTYYLKGSGKTKTYSYFKRYLRRIVDSYADLNEEKFMEAMKYLLTGYTENDYVCKYAGNFQYNVFIKHYLYHDFRENAPSGWTNWEAHNQFVTKDQLVKLKGRYEFKKEIWDSHLDVVADIAANANVDVVFRACYYILKDSPNSQKFISDMDYGQLVKLALVPYKPLSEMFKRIFKERMDKLTAFDPVLMLALMDCTDEDMNKTAMDYFRKTGGRFSTEIIAELLLLDNINQWEDLFEQNLRSLGGSQYIEFIRNLLKSVSGNAAWGCSLATKITDSLMLSANKVQQTSEGERNLLMKEIIEALLHKKLPDWMAAFLEEVVFSFTYENMEAVLRETEISPAVRSTSVRNKSIISILESIKFGKLPKDSDIINILESGSAKMIKALVDILNRNKSQLNDRLSTLLIMFESDVITLNRLAEEVFDNMQKEEQKKLHSMVIDSPVERAFSIGLKKLDLIYKELIPAQFIIHMLEHGSNQVKAYISDKIDNTIASLGKGNEELFIYYLKTLLLLPNKNSKSKDKIYKVLPQFVRFNKDKLDEVERILLDIGGSNNIIDSERALVTLAKIRKDGELNAG